MIVVLGLHTVFEHRVVMGRDALAVFLSEYQIDFPVGIDRHDRDPIPLTMQHCGLRGTLSTVLIDRGGRLRHSAFGTVDDLVLGAQLGQLLAEAPITPPSVTAGVGISESTYRWFSAIAGGAAGAVTLIGFLGLVSGVLPLQPAAGDRPRAVRARARLLRLRHRPL